MAGSSKDNQKSILIIEDDQFISEMYAKLLVKAGYDVVYALNGREGLEKAKKRHYDLILLDIMMPELTGIEVLKELRGKDGEGLPNSKIVILTNLGQTQASQEALKAKADGYLIKADIVPSRLLEIIDKLIS